MSRPNGSRCRVCPSGKGIVSYGQSPISGHAQITQENDQTFGQGQGLLVTDSNDQRVELMVFPGLPFVLMRETMKNSSTQEVVLNNISVGSFAVQLETPASKLQVRGTGGLYAANEYGNGIYEWYEGWKAQFHPRAVSPAERKLRVDGCGRSGNAQRPRCRMADPRTCDRAALSQVRQRKLGIDLQAEFGNLRLAPGQTAQSETMAIGYFDDVRIGLEQWANEVARFYHVKLPPQPAGYCTWYAESHGGSSDEKNVAVLGDFIKANLESYGMNFVQIDDGWQLGDSHHNGPNKNFTDSNPKGPFPAGMKAIADRLEADGLTPGLWFIPFGGTYNDDWFADKQDLFMKDQGWKALRYPVGRHLPRHDQSQGARLRQGRRRQHCPQMGIQIPENGRLLHGPRREADLYQLRLRQ